MLANWDFQAPKFLEMVNEIERWTGLDRSEDEVPTSVINEFEDRSIGQSTPLSRFFGHSDLAFF